MTIIAHTKNSLGRQQPLEEHLRNVADAAKQYCASFGGATIAHCAGLLHDIGKYDPEFQAYLLNAEQSLARHMRGPDHKGAGAVLAETFEHKGALAFMVHGHHGGIASRAKLQPHIREHKARKPVQDAIEKAKKVLPELRIPPKSLFPPYISSALELEFFTRMVFSALVDADFLDTEQHFNAGKRLERENTWNIARLWEQFASWYQQRFAQVPQNQLNTIRAEVQQYCIDAAIQAPGIFRLTVPTGGGKTLASLTFALLHAQQHGLERVIYAIPYTSIIDQTAKVFRDVFSDEQAFIEHHGDINLQDPENPLPAEIHRRLAAENWDTSLIVTTTVQLFESLLGHGTGKCRKLHNIAKSVIVLDEVQLLPVRFLTTILDVLRQLVTHYGVSLVLCTATQPDFESRQGFEGLPNIHEIVPAPERYFEHLKRVEYQLPVAGETWTWEQVANRVQAEQQVLVIVNTRRDAIDLLDILTENDDTSIENASMLFHLSTRLCGAHRKAVLEEVSRRLKVEEPCCLIATQVIEAGVDVNFPLVMRAIAPLDSIVQAAGRANREGTMPLLGKVIVFVPESGHAPKGSYLVGTDIAERLLKDGSADLHDPSLYQKYFREYYSYPYRDRYGIEEMRKRLDYPQVAKNFCMIEDESVPVIVQYPSSPDSRHIVKERLDRLRNSTHLHRDDLRALQPYIVNLLTHEFKKAQQQNLVEEVISGVWEWRGGYDSGLDGKHGQGIPLDSVVSAEMHIW